MIKCVDSPMEPSGATFGKDLVSECHTKLPRTFTESYQWFNGPSGLSAYVGVFRVETRVDRDLDYTVGVNPNVQNGQK